MILEPDDEALEALLKAILSGDEALALHLTSASPHLSKWAAATGATRAQAKPYYTGDTALHLAARSHQPDLIAKLIAQGADVCARNRRGAEPIHYGAMGMPGSARWNPDSQVAALAALIAAGADVNAANMDGATPLHLAVRTRCADVVALLIDNGADIHARNNNGSTPPDLARQATGRSGSGSPAAKAQQTEILALFARCEA
jgi:hypothetical protein